MYITLLQIVQCNNHNETILLSGCFKLDIPSVGCESKRLARATGKHFLLTHCQRIPDPSMPTSSVLKNLHVIVVDKITIIVVFEIDKIVEAWQAVQNAVESGVARTQSERPVSEGLVKRVEAGGSPEVHALLPVAQMIKLRLNVLQHELQNGHRLVGVGVVGVQVALCRALCRSLPCCHANDKSCSFLCAETWVHHRGLNTD